MTRTDLWPHQAATVKRIVADGGSHCLAHEVGAGKSLSTIAYLEFLHAELQRPLRVLIVAPKSVLGVWPAQLEQHCSLEYRVDVLDDTIPKRLAALSTWQTASQLDVAVLGYSTFSQKPADAALRALQRFEPDVVVLDEGHAIRGPQSNVSKFFARAAKFCPRRLLLSGTLMPHSPLDLLGQLRFVDPDTWSSGGRPLSQSKFVERFGVLGGYQGRVIVDWKDRDLLNDLAAKKSSVVRTAECIELPRIRYETREYRMSRAETKAYREMQRDLLTVLNDETITAQNKLVSMLRLRQISSGFLPLEDGRVEKVGTSRHDAALALIDELLVSENRVVVWGWSRHELDALARTMIERQDGVAAGSQSWDVTVTQINGDTSNARRQTYLNMFGSDDPDRQVLFAQIASLSSGVNSLVKAAHGIFLSPSQRLEEFVQACGRLHRPGQERPVTIWKVCAKDTVDEVVYQNYQKRGNLETQLMDHIRKVR